MSIDRRLLGWGVFLVLLGGVPLAVTQGWIPRETVTRAWELWPLILIGAGIGLILSRTALSAIGGLVVAATFGIMLGAFISVGFSGFNLGSVGCGGAEAGAPQILDERGSFDGSSSGSPGDGQVTGSVVLSASCATVEVTTGPGAGWSVAVRGTDSARPAVERSDDRLVVRSPEAPVVVPFTTQRSTWHVELGTDPRLDVELTLNAGDANVDLGAATIGRLAFDGNAVGDTRLDLAQATVQRLDVTVNAADVAIRLPETADLVGAVDANASSVHLCAAPGVGLRLLVEDNITASDNFGNRGLIRSGDTWQTPGYAGAPTKVVLRLAGSAVSFSLDPEDGCR